MNHKVIVVTRQTRLEELIQRFNTVEQARFYIEGLGGDFSDYLDENCQYEKAKRQVEEILLDGKMRYHFLERRFLANYIFNPDDVVIVLGQDGLVANSMKYLDGQSLIAVNPDPIRWEGRLLPFQINDVQRILAECLRDKRCCTEVTMAALQLNDGQSLLAVNDFFIGSRHHSSFRYTLAIDGERESQSSSGIIISAPLGGSAWLKSLLTGAQRIISQFEKIPENELQLFNGWSDNKLVYTVREPFISLYSQANNCFGMIENDRSLIIESETPEQGIIFSDGVEEDFLEFNSGAVASIGIAEKKGMLVI
ncbi:MAG: sugar kinase [Lentisphaeraceae bacterium]|nr:sugar kinase [Lentisphaeraceae bacterium]